MDKDTVIGFGDDEGDEGDEEFIENSKKKSAKKSGGFQSMALSYPVYKGILKRGYKIPTPIQRKTIPLALEGRDVVAMARTGSGKTACFLIPLFEKLKERKPQSGARALILSPTRELAIQTLKFIKEIGKYTGLLSAVILGGDSMEYQFDSLHSNPDIVVATPGRFLHLCVEMDLKLNNVEYVVFDEADRLFEMGFGEQIQEVINRLPDNRQTLLFSATLPKVLVEFAKAGLSDPVLLRLDVESKLPEQLKLKFIVSRPEEKLPVLLNILRSTADDSQTVVFAATQHHVEYLHLILDKAGISNTFLYSSLDSSARKINAAKFQNKKAKVLIVTDVAARGIDIPHLDNVINFNFPAKSKLFVHRVGRCARAGRSGTAYNIVAADEFPYLLDLFLFLGRTFQLVPSAATAKDKVPEEAIGKMPQELIEEQLSDLAIWHENSTDIKNMEKVCSNGYQQYLRSRPAASVASVKRVKELCINEAGYLPEYCNVPEDTANILARMKNYRPLGTVFEIGAKPSADDYKAMKVKRAFHKKNIADFHRKVEERNAAKDVVEQESETKCVLPSSNADDIRETFNQVIEPKKRKIEDLYRNSKKKMKKQMRDDEFYIPYAAPDRHTEEGLAVNNFTQEANNATIEFSGDNEQSMKLQKQIKKWDRKKKKMVTVNNESKVKKIRTESGAWIPATYKTNKYSQWKEKNKIDANDDDFDEDDEEGRKYRDEMKKLRTTGYSRWARQNQKTVRDMKSKMELKRPEQVLKQRKLQDKKKRRNGKHKKGGKRK